MLASADSCKFVNSKLDVGQPCIISAIVPAWQSADPRGLKLGDATEKRVSVLNIGRQSEEFGNRAMAKLLFMKQ